MGNAPHVFAFCARATDGLVIDANLFRNLAVGLLRCMCDELKEGFFPLLGGEMAAVEVDRGDIGVGVGVGIQHGKYGFDLRAEGKAFGVEQVGDGHGVAVIAVRLQLPRGPPSESVGDDTHGAAQCGLRARQAGCDHRGVALARPY